jgi:hypothetical protein
VTRRCRCASSRWLWCGGTACPRWRRGEGAAEEKGTGGAGGPRATQELGLGFGGCPLYSGGATLACGPGAGGVAGDLGGGLLRRGRKRRGGRSADAWGPTVRGRRGRAGEGERARAEGERWAGARPTREKEREGGWSSGLAHAGRRGKRREGERDGPREEPAHGLWLLSFFSFSFSILKHSNKTIRIQMQIEFKPMNSTQIK